MAHNLKLVSYKKPYWNSKVFLDDFQLAGVTQLDLHVGVDEVTTLKLEMIINGHDIDIEDVTLLGKEDSV